MQLISQLYNCVFISVSVGSGSEWGGHSPLAEAYVAMSSRKRRVGGQANGQMLQVRWSASLHRSPGYNVTKFLYTFFLGPAGSK
jgi:hypothetical protein